MKLIFEFPHKGIIPDVGAINEFLSKTDLTNKSSRHFGVYRRKIAGEIGHEGKQILLNFKFFDNDRKEKKEYEIKINLGYFRKDVAEEKKALKKFKRDICLLSYVAALSLQSVKFSIDGDFLAVRVELDDSYQEIINTHKKLILS